MDAAAQPIGFIPRFPRPPKYLRVRAHYKKEKTFDKVFVAQELDGRDEPTDTAENPSSNSSAAGQSDRSDGRALWAMVFSNDGRYLAAAGQDKKVRVWAVISSPEDRDSEGDSTQGDEPPPLKAPVFKAKPVQVYEGHSGSILDLSWSKVCQYIHCLDQTDLCRTISSSLRQWTKPSVCGTSQGRNACAASNTAISSLPSSSIPAMTVSSWLDLSTQSSAYGVFPIKAWRS